MPKSLAASLEEEEEEEEEKDLGDMFVLFFSPRHQLCQFLKLLNPLHKLGFFIRLNKFLKRTKAAL